MVVYPGLLLGGLPTARLEGDGLKQCLLWEEVPVESC